jgi:Uma2 family endonuclease
MPTTTAGRLLTADEFFALPDPPGGGRLELVRGEVVVMAGPGLEHGEVQLAVGSLLRAFVKPRQLGRVFTESGAVTERDPDTVRGPDVSYYSRERLPLDARVVGYHDQPPDLCVEVLSPSNTKRAMNHKLREYFFAGVRAVWVIDPEARSVTVFRDPIEGRHLTEAATLDGGDVLPGFACPVADLFA